MKEVKIDLGVLDTDNGRFINYIEKPTFRYEVSMGIYSMNRGVIELIPENKKFDMPELMLLLRE